MKPRQYFILCPSFHGSSILCLLLNNHGRVRAIADSNPDGALNYECVCGKTFKECEFWSHIRQCVGEGRHTTVFPTMPQFLPMNGLNAKIVHGINHLALLGGPRVWSLFGKAPKVFKSKYAKFAEGVQSWTPSEVFVDAQKNLLTAASWATMGGQVDGIIHLVRDPRAYVASAMKIHKSKDVGGFSLRWLSEHNKINHYLDFLKAPHMLLRYEDFVERPRTEIDRLFSFLGVETQDVFYPAKDTKKHHMYGNHSIRSFDGKVYANEKWREILPEPLQRQILRFTSPLSGQYGYGQENDLDKIG